MHALETPPRRHRFIRGAFARALYRRSRLRTGRAGLALVYHRLDHRSGDPARELVPAVGAEVFKQQLRYLKDNYRLVLASDLMRACARRRRGARIPLAITFDDDLQSHVEFAMPILLEAGIPATFFVCGRSLSAPFAFWWERLQAAMDSGPLSRRVVDCLGLQSESARSIAIHDVASAIKRISPQERDRIAGELSASVGPDPQNAGLRASQLRALAEAGFEIGFHTLRHDVLTALDDEALDAALVDGRARIEEVAATSVNAIAYPHGEADQRVADAARRVGFTAGFTVLPEPTRADADPLLIGRIEPLARSGRELVEALRSAL